MGRHSVKVEKIRNQRAKGPKRPKWLSITLLTKLMPCFRSSILNSSPSLRARRTLISKTITRVRKGFSWEITSCSWDRKLWKMNTIKLKRSLLLRWLKQCNQLELVPLQVLSVHQVHHLRPINPCYQWSPSKSMRRSTEFRKLWNLILENQNTSPNPSLQSVELIAQVIRHTNWIN